MNTARIEISLHQVADAYPEQMRPEQHRDVERTAFNISLALSGLDIPSSSICDLGGGVGLFSIGCKALGCRRSVLVDDFRDSINLERGESVLSNHRRLGVEIHSRDLIGQPLALDGPFDVITTFDSMEHWHHSPRRLFREVISLLRPSGRFVLGVPNCKNLRKRITIPLGYGKWSSFQEWYEPEVFRGHVREPDVEDLRSIADDMELRDVRIVGRNWTGHASPNRLTRSIARFADVPLRTFPSLCGDIYLIGTKP